MYFLIFLYYVVKAVINKFIILSAAHAELGKK